MISERAHRRGDPPESLPGRRWAFAASLDKLQFGAVLFLTCVGLVFIYSTGVQAGDGGHFFRRQLIWLAVGGVAYFGCAVPDLSLPRYRVFAALAYLATVVMLVLVLVPGVGIRVYGATRWLGAGSLRIQPSEFAKLGLILALSSLFSSMLFKIDRPGGPVAGALVTLLPAALIVIEPDLGSAIVCVPVFLTILFCAGLKWRFIFIGVLAAALLAGAVFFNETMRIRPMLTNYQRNRIRTFLNPEFDRSGAGYNAYQAKLAVGSGGLTGKGIGEGTQNTLGFLPQTVANNDFIFSVIAEETGFFGALTLICAYILLLYSILRTAFVTEEVFGRSLCVGVAAMFFTHLFLNIGMSIGVMPITG
ncbi:MAG: rod shape-determining protein RodA, partial [Lentisphaeria bacterium]|nr:rod shape-determining protein RodA [Lentisphaeria bacterium]